MTITKQINKRFFELQTVELKFVEHRPEQIKVGMLIGLHSGVPTRLEDFGYVEDIIDEPLGFNYGIRELKDDKLQHYSRNSITPILPVLISDDSISYGDTFYTNRGEIYVCENLGTRFLPTKAELIYTKTGLEFLAADCKKVMATPAQIGWKFSKRYLNHDHAWDYKGGSVEQYHPDFISNIVRNDFKVDVEVQEICPNYGGAHIGKDCSCKSGFTTRAVLFFGMVVMHWRITVRKRKGSKKQSYRKLLKPPIVRDSIIKKIEKILSEDDDLGLSKAEIKKWNKKLNKASCKNKKKK